MIVLNILGYFGQNKQINYAALTLTKKILGKYPPVPLLRSWICLWLLPTSHPI